MVYFVLNSIDKFTLVSRQISLSIFLFTLGTFENCGGGSLFSDLVIGNWVVPVDRDGRFFEDSRAAGPAEADNFRETENIIHVSFKPANRIRVYIRDNERYVYKSTSL